MKTNLKYRKYAEMSLVFALISNDQRKASLWGITEEPVEPSWSYGDTTHWTSCGIPMEKISVNAFLLYMQKKGLPASQEDAMHMSNTDKMDGWVLTFYKSYKSQFNCPLAVYHQFSHTIFLVLFQRHVVLQDSLKNVQLCKASNLERVYLQTCKVGEGKLSQHGLCGGEGNVKYCIL